MSDRDPESDWEQPRGDFSRGGGPHYSGTPSKDQSSTADGGTRRNRFAIPVAALLILFVIGLAVFALTR